MNDTSVFSQEFLLSTKLGDATQIVLGAYYENRDGDNTSLSGRVSAGRSINTRRTIGAGLRFSF